MAEPRVTTCTVILDLAGVLSAGDPADVERVLAARRGVLVVKPAADGWRTRVTYDVTGETLPGLWNWLVDERRQAADQAGWLSSRRRSITAASTP